MWPMGRDNIAVCRISGTCPTGAGERERPINNGNAEKRLFCEDSYKTQGNMTGRWTGNVHWRINALSHLATSYLIFFARFHSVFHATRAFKGEPSTFALECSVIFYLWKSLMEVLPCGVGVAVDQNPTELIHTVFFLITSGQAYLHSPQTSPQTKPELSFLSYRFIADGETNAYSIPD